MSLTIPVITLSGLLLGTTLVGWIWGVVYPTPFEYLQRSWMDVLKFDYTMTRLIDSGYQTVSDALPLCLTSNWMT